jgi:hypothetical protein
MQTPSGLPVVGLTVSRDSLRLMTVTSGGAAMWISAPIAGSLHARLVENFSLARSTNGLRVSMTSGIPNTLPVERSYSVVTAKGLVWKYAEQENELHAYDLKGSVVHRILLPTMPVAPTPARGDSLRTQRLAMNTDTLGRIWMEIPRAHTRSVRDWWVVDSGRIVAVATTPANMGPIWIGANSMILLAFDKDGVETLRVCGLHIF